MEIGPTLRERYESRVIRKEGCWDWSGFKIKGYGRVRNNGKETYAHRAAYVLFVGPIKEGLMVLHKCDNPSCSNPDHLYLGTYVDNMKDCVDRKRHISNPPLGEKRANSKLKNSLVLEIVERLSSGTEVVKLAKLYNISPQTICDIKYGRTWKSVTNGILPVFKKQQREQVLI